ncbi:Secreted RxLR effector peptide protein [Phytophthora palmivora]|uniref:Secreted RxLR effector peptide protein n=1 Tax=Phytophthora palmivora TaxID=4796 RepID=A0A2P4XDH0_9STRA|nr:Secreted RxLR effector peptide protein [Phytophthora palmivora]
MFVEAIRGAVSSVQLNWNLRTWLASSTKADDVFNALDLKLAGDKLFENSHWKPFTEYVTKLDSSDADNAIVTALMRIYDNVGLSKLLAAAKKVPATEAEALKWEGVRLKFWLKNNVSPDEIFKVLQLNKAADDLFDSPQFVTWVNYLKMFNEKNSDKKTSMVGAFARGYGEEALMKTLVSAENANSVGATKMKNEVLQAYLDFTTSPNQLFKILKLDKEGDKLLSSPLLNTWVEYMNLFNKDLPKKKTTMIAVFTKNYGDESLAKMIEAAKANPSTKEFATNLQSAQFSQWMTEGRSPKNILDDVLKLDSNALLVDDVSGDIWRAYNKAYAKQFPESGFAFQP